MTRTVYFDYEINLGWDEELQDEVFVTTEVTVSLEGSFEEGWSINKLWTHVDINEEEESILVDRLWKQEQKILERAVAELWS